MELVKLRASLMNGWAYCIDLHTKDARANAWNRLAVTFRPAVAATSPQTLPWLPPDALGRIRPVAAIGSST
jgi:AhpD family alkylhydroperoxidase